MNAVSSARENGITISIIGINLDTQGFNLAKKIVEIGQGRVKELQQQKTKTGEVSTGEFGVLIEAKVEIALGDHIESFIIVEK